MRRYYKIIAVGINLILIFAFNELASLGVNPNTFTAILLVTLIGYNGYVINNVQKEDNKVVAKVLWIILLIGLTILAILAYLVYGFQFADR